MVRRQSGDDGMTVPEMAVTLALLSLVMTVVFASFASLQNGFIGANERTTNLSEARLIMQQSSKDIRTATRIALGESPFSVAKPAEMTFYANLDPSGRPSKVRLFIDASSRLIEEATLADATSSAPNYTFVGQARTRMVGSYVINGASGKPPFDYVDASNSSLAMSSGCGCLVDADRLKVRAVGVRFSVRHSTSLKVAPTTLETRVRLPNVDYNQLTPGP